MTLYNQKSHVSKSAIDISVCMVEVDAPLRAQPTLEVEQTAIIGIWFHTL